MYLFNDGTSILKLQGILLTINHYIILFFNILYFIITRTFLFVVLNYLAYCIFIDITTNPFDSIFLYVRINAILMKD